MQPYAALVCGVSTRECAPPVLLAALSIPAEAWSSAVIQSCAGMFSPRSCTIKHRVAPAKVLEVRAPGNHLRLDRNRGYGMSRLPVDLATTAYRYNFATACS